VFVPIFLILSFGFFFFFFFFCRVVDALVALLYFIFRMIVSCICLLLDVYVVFVWRLQMLSV
jgi:hypothetical protein